MKYSKSTALLLALLITAVVSTIAFSIGKLSISEIKMAGSTADSIAAYFAAEAGIEHGLARFRWDRNIEIAESKKFGDWSSNPPEYDLKIWYKADKIGDPQNLSKSPQLKRDETKEYALKNVSDLVLKWSDVQGGPGFVSLEYVIYKKDSQETVKKDVSVVSSRSFSIDFTAEPDKIYILRIKPWIGDSFDLAQIAQGTPANKESLYINYAIVPTGLIDSGYTYIESTGYYKNTKRKLRATIDRESGTLKEIFDFTLFAPGEGID